MKTTIIPTLTVLLALLAYNAAAAEMSLDSAPPVVVRTVPMAGATNVDARLNEIQVTFSKPMRDRSWSWSTWGKENFPELTGEPRYLEDQRTCVLPVNLQPGRFYATWLNSERFKNFKDTNDRPAVPYLLTFVTSAAQKAASLAAAARNASEVGAHGDSATTRAHPRDTLLNPDQRAVLAWTDRQFRGFFDARTFDGWSANERDALQVRLIDTLRGPHTRDYYQAINTLAAMSATNALPALRSIGLEHREKDNRDRWMAIRALGTLNDQASVPELIHLVYHGNLNTRWWAQISLVRLTGQNFGGDWKAWGTWWNERHGQPPFTPEIVRWWSGQVEPEKLADSLAEGDRRFLNDLKKRQ